jgi:hypothetical protein
MMELPLYGTPAPGLFHNINPALFLTVHVETCLTRLASDLTRRKAIPIQLVRELLLASPCLSSFLPSFSLPR